MVMFRNTILFLYFLSGKDQYGKNEERAYITKLHFTQKSLTHYSHRIKRYLFLGRITMTNPDSVLKVEISLC